MIETAKEIILRMSIPEPNSGCWLWLYSDRKGYGQVVYSNRKMNAHRLSYESFIGPIPEDMQLHHVCDIKLCVNPDHLQIVDQSEHSKITWDKRTKITHCPHGHEYTAENTRYNSRWAKTCIQCIRKSGLASYYRNRGRLYF